MCTCQMADWYADRTWNLDYCYLQYGDVSQVNQGHEVGFPRNQALRCTLACRVLTGGCPGDSPLRGSEGSMTGERQEVKYDEVDAEGSENANLG